jgi:hypothetical protein
MSQPIGSLFGGCNPVVSATNPGKVIHKYGIFEFEEDLNNSPWFVPTPLKFAHPVNPLPHKFKNICLYFMVMELLQWLNIFVHFQMLAPFSE